jgi:poly(3-hydroxybutyrate) depolymerase
MPGSIRFFALCALGLCLLLGQAYAGSSTGCGRAFDPGFTKGGTGKSNKVIFTSKGVKRTALVHFPLHYDISKATGLIFAFHGRSGSAAKMESLSKLSEPEKNEHMLVVYPEGIDQQWQGDPKATSDDVTFTLDMMKVMVSLFCIDPDKIYAAGQSNGGGFAANILACDPKASRGIAAFAGVSGAYYQGTTGANCQPLRVPIPCNTGRKNVPILDFHGQKDETIPFAGGARRDRCLPNLPHFMTAWAQRNGLGESFAQSNLANNHVKKLEWGKGDLKGINTHYSIDNMGHTWPNEKSYFIAATPLIMDFFRKWTLASTPGGHDKPVTFPVPGSEAPSDPLCPFFNDKIYHTPGKGLNRGIFFRILCGSDTAKHPSYAAPTYPGSLEGCVQQCADDNKCGHVVFYKDKCWKKMGKPGSIDETGNASVAQKLPGNGGG